MRHIEYKNYIGSVEVDVENKTLYGKVQGIADLISYQGKDVVELIKDFHEAIDEYIEDCKTLGKEPGKPFAGKIILRTSPEMHAAITLASKNAGVNVNTWLNLLVSKEVGVEPPRIKQKKKVDDSFNASHA